MTNITKKLEKEKENRLDGATAFVEETKLLLSGRASEERQVLRDMGLTAHLNEIDNQHEQKMLNSRYSKEYTEGKVFHAEELRKVWSA